MIHTMLMNLGKALDWTGFMFGVIAAIHPSVAEWGVVILKAAVGGAIGYGVQRILKHFFDKR